MELVLKKILIFQQLRKTALTPEVLVLVLSSVHIGTVFSHFVIWTSLRAIIMAPKKPKISKQTTSGITRHITFTIPETLEIIKTM
jgi:hypothetical protein